MYTGKFITFEGNEGCGKTTVSNKIYEALIRDGFDVISTREPGGIDIAEQIREIILDHKNIAMDARCEALLYAAARRQHLVEKVIPALQRGAIVLCDRFLDSSLAYQGIARGLGIAEILEINKFAIDGTMPDTTILLRIEPEIGLERIATRSEHNRLDAEGINFHKQVAKGYDEVMAMYPDRIRVIDATKTEEEVFRDAYQIVEKLVKGHV